jgi:hypothetical protein
MEVDLNELSHRATELLIGKTVHRVRVHTKEVFVEFTDGTRLFVDSTDRVELSITDGIPPEDVE